MNSIKKVDEIACNWQQSLITAHILPSYWNAFLFNNVSLVLIHDWFTHQRLINSRGPAKSESDVASIGLIGNTIKAKAAATKIKEKNRFRFSINEP